MNYAYTAVLREYDNCFIGTAYSGKLGILGKMDIPTDMYVITMSIRTWLDRYQNREDR